MHHSGGHSGHGHSGSGQHHSGVQAGGGLSISHLLGLHSGHGHGFLSQIGHMLGLNNHHHHTLHHGHGSSGAPDQSPSWNMAQQVSSNPWRRLLEANLRFTPSMGFFFLFFGLSLWLGVVYLVRHHEPAEHFDQLASQLYTRQLPTARIDGQRLPSIAVPDPVITPDAGASIASQSSRLRMHQGPLNAWSLPAGSPGQTPATEAAPPAPASQRLRIVINR